ncbi:sensor histidine kinase [Sphingomonas sp. CFBP 13720]|uniref:sensor histidine kinase n=1 Tax=Sphingomonas sp. CFBP 13720 TaxID=2775302 RepID=UPI00177D21E2|nr:histidine kinase dimerization/phospho-acceptor domain-containing protein [Sphingomonas sp. CFBP 13720]MBD8678932.1 sensor histidine kinase [Sphingomonas sp. CFBP 13720]
MVRFDDTLETVLAADLSGESARASAWRQLVDLIGRGRVAADDRAITTLRTLRDGVPRTVRMGSARAIEHASPPAALVEVLATDRIEIAVPVLRGATLSIAEWTALLPKLAPAARGVLRNRRDLDPAVQRALESFGSTDLVLGDDRLVIAPDVPVPLALPEAPVPVAVPLAPAVSLPTPVAEAEPAPAGPFRITDVMARIEAFERVHERPFAAAPVQRRDEFRFETDATGVIRWVDGVARSPVIGLSLAIGGEPGHAQVDAVAAGALRRRAPFRDARLAITGDSDAAGHWCISGVPAFDHASGRFTGYRGTARRPRRDQRAEPVAGRDTGIAQLRQLVHELRTPAGAIAGFAEMIEAQLLGPVSPVYRSRAGAILDHSRDLVAVIDDLDLAARIDGDALDLRADRVALDPVFATIAGDLTALCELRGSLLEIEPAAIAVLGDRRAVERLLARLLATLVSASAPDEAIHVRMGVEADGNVAIVFDRPAALDAWPGDSVFDVDDGDEDPALLGTGFAFRLARNLAVELGGVLSFGSATLTLRLPAADTVTMGQAQQQ